MSFQCLFNNKMFTTINHWNYGCETTVRYIIYDCLIRRTMRKWELPTWIKLDMVTQIRPCQYSSHKTYSKNYISRRVLLKNLRWKNAYTTNILLPKQTEPNHFSNFKIYWFCFFFVFWPKNIVRNFFWRSWQPHETWHQPTEKKSYHRRTK